MAPVLPSLTGQSATAINAAVADLAGPHVFCQALQAFSSNLDCKKPVRLEPRPGNEHEGRTMFAVIRAGGKQYRVAPEDVIRIDRVEAEPGAVVEFGEVLLLGGDTPQLGVPTVAGATVAGEVLQHARGDRVIAFKKRRRKNSRRKRGYRHEFSLIRITEILTEGAKPSQTPPARPKREAKKPAGEAASEAAAGEAAPKKRAAAKKKPAAKKPSKASTTARNTKGKKK
jgi:large subunit ribosomal protein L21